MRIDGSIDRYRARFLGRTDGHEETDQPANRRQLRASGLQGRTGSITYKDGMIQGRPRGRFMGAGRRPAILISNAPGWEARLIQRIGRQNGRSRRIAQRIRARGEEVSA